MWGFLPVYERPAKRVMALELDTFKHLGEALALGLLVGIERYRGRVGDGHVAGVRTFAIFGLIGGIAGLLESPVLTAVTFAAVAGLILISYYRSPAEKLGLTTEVAAILVFWLGYLVGTYEVEAISAGIVLTIFLASKKRLHEFVRERISSSEFEATLKFLAVVLVIYPVLPDRALDPYGFFNPRQIWGLVILVSSVSYVGYFLMRWLGERRGLMVSSVAGGLVSTTATTMSLAARSRRVPEASRLFGTNAVLANSVQGLRLLVLIWAVNRELANTVAVPLIGMCVVGLVGSWFLSRRLRDESEEELEIKNPYSLRPALTFGAYFVAIFGLVKLTELWLGARGVLLASAVAGAGSVSAVALSVSTLLGQGSLPLSVAAQAVLIAIATNAMSKWIVARVNGGGEMARWLGGGLVTMLATAALLLYFGPSR